MGKNMFYSYLEQKEKDLDESQEGELIPLKYSRSEILRKKDFADYSDEELSEAYQLMKSILKIFNL